MDYSAIRALAQAMLSSPQEEEKKLLPGAASQEALKAPALNSPLSNDVEKQVEPGVVQGQEKALFDQNQARQNSFVTPEVELPQDANTAVVGPNGAPMNADALMQDAISARDGALSGNSIVADQQMKAAKEQNAVDLQIKEASKPAEDLLHSRIEQGYKELDQTQREVESQTKSAISNYEHVTSQLADLAAKDPQDFLGQAGVNQYLGSIAMMVGGMGTNGNHENRAIEQFKMMADRNVAAQRQQFENLEKVGQGYKTVYGMLHDRLRDKTAVEQSLRNAALETYKTELLRVGNQYAKPTAKAALDGAIAKISESQNSNNQAAAQSYMKNAQGILAIKGQENANKLALAGENIKQRMYQQENAIDGVVGWVPKSSHERLSKMTAGARTMIGMTNHIEDMIRGGANLATIRAYMVANAVQFKGARDFLETGTRIEAGEQRVIDQLNPAAKDSLFSAASEKLFSQDPLSLLTKLDAIRSTVTETAYTGIHTAAPQTTAFDKNDPLWGRYEPGVYKDLAQKQLEKLNGNPKGRAEIDTLKPYGGN